MNIAIIAYILYISVVYREWIFFKVITGGDWIFFFRSTMSTLRIFYFSTWLGDGLGRVLIDASQAPSYAIYGFLAKYLNFPYFLSERLVHMWPIIILGFIGSFLLLSSIFENKKAILIGVIVYMLNTFMLQYETGFLTLSVAIVLAPLVIFLFIKFLVNKNFKWFFLAVLVGYIESSYEFRAFYITSMILFLYLIFYIFFIEEVLKIKTFFFGILFFIFIGFLNFFWLLPIFITKNLFQNNLFSRGLFGNQFLNIDYALTLFHPFWTGVGLKIFIVQSIFLYFWIIPIFAFLGLILNRKNKNILFFGIISLIGILLVKQVGQPFSEIYLWFYFHIPGFEAFREASKFYFLIALGYSVLIGGFIDYIWMNWVNNKQQIYGKYFLTFLIAFIFLWNTKPLITGEIGTLFVPRYIPRDYILTKNFILKQPKYFRTLWIPIYSRWSIYTNVHPILSMADLVSSNWQELFFKASNSNSIFGGKSYIDFFDQGYMHNLASVSSVKYIFIPLEDNANDDNFFPNYGESRQYYINALNKINWLKRINIGTKEIAIYENSNFRPHIYTTLKKETIIKNIPYKKIEYSFINPTQYAFVLKNVKNPLYVDFSESYNSDWRMHVGNFNWFSVLTNKNYFLSKIWHFQNDATLNSFYVDPKIVCKVASLSSNGCVKNSDGTYTIYGTLYFTPQSYMYLGLIISGTTLIGILGYLGFVVLKFVANKYEKN